VGKGQENVGRQRSELANAAKANGKIETPPHPDSDGLNGSYCEHEINPSQGGFDAQRDLIPCDDDGNATDTSIRRMERYGRGSENRKFQTNEFNEDNSQRQSRLDWHNFPTQPPVCSRNDGISSRLDGITIPKWRNESIKAAGNAIVPQVALQIFKAIEQYERNKG
jgi:DNA (cytosine-5)-methyltransferase 1